MSQLRRGSISSGFIWYLSFLCVLVVYPSRLSAAHRVVGSRAVGQLTLTPKVDERPDLNSPIIVSVALNKEEVLVGLTEYDTQACTPIDTGTWEVVEPPGHGTVRSGIVTAPLQSNDQCNGTVMPFNIAYYTWDDAQTSDTTDPFTLHWFTADGKYSTVIPFVAELQTCRDQMTVQNFVGTGQPGFAVEYPDGMHLALNTSQSGLAGVYFNADVHIDDGVIPVDTIHVRFIQNVTRDRGSARYTDQSKYAVISKAPLPLVDWEEGPPPFPYYDCCPFIETPDTGSDRSLKADDSPEIIVPLSSTNPTRELVSISIREALEMYLGCYDDADTRFRTVAVLPWSISYSGSFNSGPPPQFTPGSKAGIKVGASASSTQSPVQTGPTAGQSIGFVWR